jgi:dethiobiotin synthetase
MGKGIFITGTDTGVGKTYVGVGLIRAAKGNGLSVCPLKPVETGCRVKNGDLIPQDTRRLMRASGVKEPMDLVNPFKMRSSLAPSVASEIEGIPIDTKRIISSYARMRGKYDLTIVEGAGGIMVPVRGKYLFLDLIRDLKIPLVIVARPGLGTINHTLLTIASAVNKKLNVIGVVINYAIQKRRGVPEKTNPAVIENLGGVPVLGTVPYLKDSSRDRSKEIFSEIMANIVSRM